MSCDNFQHRPTATHHRAEKGSMKNSTSISASTCCNTSSGTSAWLQKKTSTEREFVHQQNATKRFLRIFRFNLVESAAEPQPLVPTNTPGHHMPQPFEGCKNGFLLTKSNMKCHGTAMGLRQISNFSESAKSAKLLYK